jgi:hypothetical protein
MLNALLSVIIIIIFGNPHLPADHVIVEVVVETAEIEKPAFEMTAAEYAVECVESARARGVLSNIAKAENFAVEDVEKYALLWWEISTPEEVWWTRFMFGWTCETERFLHRLGDVADDYVAWRIMCDYGYSYEDALDVVYTLVEAVYS